MKNICHFAFLALSLSSLGCVSADSLNRGVQGQVCQQQKELGEAHRGRDVLQAERTRLEIQLRNCQARERNLMAGAVTPAEEAELERVRQEIRKLKQDLGKLAAAG